MHIEINVVDELIDLGGGHRSLVYSSYPLDARNPQIRRAVVLSAGKVVTDGRTYDVLTDDALMGAHRLELPFGFDPKYA